MSGKSRRKKGRHLPQSKKRKSRQPFLATAVRQSVVAQTGESVSRSEAPVPSVSVPTTMAKLAAVRYPHVTTELRMIGILAGIILVILAILALVLS